MALSVVDWSGWAGNILSCQEDTTTPTGVVVCYLQNNIGNLNATLGTCYTVSGESGNYINPDMGNIESGIYTEMYICSSYRKLTRQNIGASACEVLTIEDPDGGKIKIASKTEKAKVARGLYKDCCECLNDLIKWYKSSGNAIATQILYNERLGNDSGIGCPQVSPPDGYYSPFNFIFNSN